MSERAIGELTALLVNELDQAVRLSSVHSPGIRIDALKLRLGQTGQETGLSLFFREYPGLDGRWQLELDARSQPVAATPASAGGLLIDAVARRPTSWIKGISHHWRARLGAQQIDSIQALADAQNTLLRRLSEEFASMAPFAFRARARALRIRVPERSSADIDRQALLSLFQLPEAEWRQLTREAGLSSTDVMALQQLAETALSCLDIRVLRGMTIGELRKPA